MEYSDELMAHFSNPKFVKDVENADGVGEVGNVACGDVMHLEIKVAHREVYPETFSKKGLQGAKTKEEIIEDIGFKTFGCAAAIASSDVVCELAKGKTIEEAEKISKDDIVEKLKGMPQIKVHCSILGIEALKKAIEDYKAKDEGNGK
jgi:nitrogen fixation protein NifU and related proteins